MLNSIKKAVFKKFNQNDTRGLFLSGFLQDGALSLSNGVLESDKNLNQLIELLYHGLFEKEKNIKKYIIDIVIDTKEETDMQKLLSTDPKQYGFCLVSIQDSSKSGVLLPNTKGVNTVQQALEVIKKKYGLNGSVKIYIFQTEKIIVD